MIVTVTVPVAVPDDDPGPACKRAATIVRDALAAAPEPDGGGFLAGGIAAVPPVGALPDNELHDDIRLPPALSTGFMSDRPEFCRLWKGPMDAETAEAVAHALAVLMERNRMLRRKLALMRKAIDDGISSARGVLTSAGRRVTELDADAPKRLAADDDGE